jgi:hypothetical protein
MNKPTKSTKKQKPAGEKDKKQGIKKKYKIRNWHEYNEMLVNRGRLMVWIDQEAQDKWQSVDSTGKRGAPQQYSDTAIETCLILKALYRLSLRATEGLVNSVLELMKLNLSSPDYSTISIRGGEIKVDIRTKTDIQNTDETLHIVVDSSGAKVYGEGEWKVRMHGWCKRRTWRKFHLAIDEKSKRIKAADMTGNETADSAMLETLTQLTKWTLMVLMINEFVTMFWINMVLWLVSLHRKTPRSGNMATVACHPWLEMRT